MRSTASPTARLKARALRRLAACALLLPGLPVQAQDVAAGRTQAQAACAVCHGPLGQAMQPGVPHLAGQQQMYLLEQLRLYRSGKRHNEVMNVIAKPLSDAQIEALALWYSSIPVRVDSP